MRIIGLAGWSGSGKTTLLVKLIPALRARGFSVSTIKHAHHAFDVDTPGKDSYEHRQAGASEVLVSSAHRFALMREMRGEEEWSLERLLAKLSPVDIVIVEGFKSEPIPKIEVWRAINDRPPLAAADPAIRVIATVDRIERDVGAEIIALDDVAALADAVERLAVPMGDIARRDAPRE